MAPKKGDRREVKLVLEMKMDASLIGAASPPPEITEEISQRKLQATVTMGAVVKTLEVNARGLETAVELTIQQAEVVQMVKNPRRR